MLFLMYIQVEMAYQTPSAGSQYCLRYRASEARQDVGKPGSIWTRAAQAFKHPYSIDGAVKTKQASHVRVPHARREAHKIASGSGPGA